MMIMNTGAANARESGGAQLVVDGKARETVKTKKENQSSWKFVVTALASFVRNILLWIAEDSSIATIVVQLGKLPTSTMREAFALRLT